MHWLFLRGLSREQRHWGDFPATFERIVEGARVHCLDLPGTGTEHLRASPDTIHAIAEDVRARWLGLRDGSSGGGEWSLLGISLGGMVAMSWCSAHPEDFARVVLLSTSAGDLNRSWKRFSFAVVPGALRSLVSPDPVARERRILSLVSRRVAEAPRVAAEWARYQQDRPVAASAVIRQLRAATAFVAPPALATPALVLAGQGDAMTDPSCARLLGSHLGARVDVHPDAGHEMALDAPEWLAERVSAWIGAAASHPHGRGAVVRMAPLGGEGELPLVIEPATAEGASLDALTSFLADHAADIQGRLTKHGAILFRGFDVSGARDFERAARAIDPDLKNDYLGTSPRNGLTDHVFSASELPPYYPIPQHCEMSFVRHPPRRLFFCCLGPSSGAGGETPLADFRSVHRDLDPEVRRRFDERQLRTIRNYAGPGGGSRFDLWKLKRWDEMFGTTDRATVERKCAENGFECTWRPGGLLRLTGVQPATKAHPVTGEPVWFNHAQVFHLSAVPSEYRRIAERQGQHRYRLLAAVAGAAIRLKALTVPDEDQAMQCTYGDGTPIPDADMDRVRDAIWKNLVFFKWRRGDVLVIDNDSVSHGRMPYAGPRSVAVAWA